MELPPGRPFDVCMVVCLAFYGRSCSRCASNQVRQQNPVGVVIRSKAMKPIFITSLAAIALLGGCVSPQARRGRVAQPEVGNRFPNFTFQDERGTTQDLSQNLGDFTVLVFSECGRDLHGPAAS